MARPRTTGYAALPSDREALRRLIAAQLREFERDGGRVQQVAIGVSGERAQGFNGGKVKA